MEREILSIIDILSKAGFTGLLVILSIPKLRKLVFGNGNGHIESKIDALKAHYNEETTEALKRIEDAIKDHDRNMTAIHREILEGIIILKTKIK